MYLKSRRQQPTFQVPTPVGPTRNPGIRQSHSRDVCPVTQTLLVNSHPTPLDALSSTTSILDESRSAAALLAGS